MLNEDLISQEPLNFLDAPSDEEEEVTTEQKAPRKKRKMNFLTDEPENAEIEEEDEHGFKNHLDHLDSQMAKIGDIFDGNTSAPPPDILMKNCKGDFLESFERNLRKNQYYSFWESFVGGLRGVSVSAILEPKNYNASSIDKEEDIQKQWETYKKTLALMKERALVLSQQIVEIYKKMMEMRKIAEKLHNSGSLAGDVARNITQVKRYLVASSAMEFIQLVRDLNRELEATDYAELYSWINVWTFSEFDTMLIEYMKNNSDKKNAINELRGRYVFWFLITNKKIVLQTIPTANPTVFPLGFQGIDEIMQFFSEDQYEDPIAALKESFRTMKISEQTKKLNSDISNVEMWISTFKDETNQPIPLPKSPTKSRMTALLENLTDWLESRQEVRLASRGDIGRLMALNEKTKKEVEAIQTEDENTFCYLTDLMKKFPASVDEKADLDVMPEFDRAVDESMVDVQLAIPALNKVDKRALMLHTDTRTSFAGLALYHYFTKVILKYPRQWRPVRTIDDMRKDVSRYIATLALYQGRGKTIRRIH